MLTCLDLVLTTKYEIVFLFDDAKFQCFLWFTEMFNVCINPIVQVFLN